MTSRQALRSRPPHPRAARSLAALALGALAFAFPIESQVPSTPSPQAPLPSPVSRLPYQASSSLRAPGSDLQVYVMTMGQGDMVWERFGHNALGIRDTRTGSDVVYNWGTFSFEQEGFISRFLRGRMLYWMAPNDAVLTAEAYRQANRSVTIQELNLTPAQRAEIQRFVEWNQREENKYYRYDYYRDNCSTRVRDAIDRVIGGSIARAAKPQLTSMSYRDHSLRLMDGMFWTRTGIDLGLGAPTDRPITSWEAMFIPMELQRRLRDVRVPHESGRLAPLVTSEREIVPSSRPAEVMTPSSHVVVFLLAGVALGAILFAVSLRTRGVVVAQVTCVLWGLIAGIFGLLLLLLWVATEHVAAHANQNLFFVNPLWLLVAATVPFVYQGRGTRRAAMLAIRACAALTVAGGVIALTPLGQPSGSIAAFVVPVNLVLYAVVVRAVHEAQQRARTTAHA